MTRFDQGWGRNSTAGIGEDADSIEMELMSRCNPRTHPRIVKLALPDALEPREPR
jgi:hypothetical protein